MIRWTINVTYGSTSFDLPADLEYHSAQIMRIRVHGKHNSLLLENDYPGLRATRSKIGIHWKIKEGKMDAGSEKNARLLTHIMAELEEIIKSEFPPLL